MKQFLSRLAHVSILQAVAEVTGLGCLALAAFMVSKPAGIAVLGLALIALGNVRLR